MNLTGNFSGERAGRSSRYEDRGVSGASTERVVQASREKLTPNGMRERANDYRMMAASANTAATRVMFLLIADRLERQAAMSGAGQPGPAVRLRPPASTWPI